MKKITEKKLREILEQHKLWLDSNEKEGKCADLTDADLRFANLYGAYLTGADLRGSNLNFANLRRADLTSADLSHTNLTSVDLSGAVLTDADLTDTDLRRADLAFANLSDANLSGANLSGANLLETDLRRANLTGTDLICVDLEYADLTDTILDEKEQCRKGIVLIEPIVGYKKASGGKIITLEIPVEAKVFSINNSKRRTNKVKVIDMQGETELSSIRDNIFKYHVGDEIDITNFDERYNVECGAGVHFFLTREEAEKYVY